MDVIENIKHGQFARNFKGEVSDFGRVSDLPISGLIFEERVDRALKRMGAKTDWSPRGNSHKPGADILGLSLKTNKISGEFTGMTSYRTATFQTWENKRELIAKQDGNVLAYLFLSRRVLKDDTEYFLYLIEKEIGSFLDLSTYEVKELNGNFFGVRSDGIKFEIRKSTSGQLIFTKIPLTSLQQFLVTSFKIANN